MSMIRTSITAAFLVVAATAVQAAEIKVISANGMREVIAETKARFEAASGHRLNVTVVETGGIRKRVPNRGSGHHAERVVKGEADMAVQAEHEIRCVPGAAFLDYPKDLQRTIVFIGSVGAATSDAAAAKTYLDFLRGPEVAPVIKAKCLSPG